MQSVIDFHTHPYLSADEFLNFYPECFTPTATQCMTDLQKAGITHICGSVIIKKENMQKEGFAHIRECNNRAMRIKEKLGDFYTPGFHVHPDYVKESIEEIERMAQKGVRLIGELVPYYHGWKDYSNKNLSKILEAAEKHQMIVSFHTMKDECEETTKMVKNHPNITFVAAHPNDKQMFLQQLERMEQCPNFYLDLSGTGIFRYGMIAYGVNRVGSERFLFGTDYPICNPRMYVQAIYQEPITQEEMNNILCHNAARILGIR